MCTADPTSQLTGTCYGVSKTLRDSEQVHVRSIINYFVEGIRLHCRSQLKGQIFFVTCNFVWDFCVRCSHLQTLGRKYGADFSASVDTGQL